MTPAGHLLSGYLVSQTIRGERRWVLAAALIGSIAPDFDVLLGLLGGFFGAAAHRGATHSLIGAAVLACLIAALLLVLHGFGGAAPLGRSRPPGRLSGQLFIAALGGILTHIFWDWLNPWGVIPLWPWMKSVRGNLLHEGDLYATALLAVSSLLAWRKHSRLSLAVVVILLPAYLTVQLFWRAHARDLAQLELAGRRPAVYPTNKVRCGWIAPSAAATDMTVHCIRSPRAAHLDLVLRVPLRDDFFTRASERSAAVREFCQKIPFPFAEVQPSADGGAVVVWRDLRVAFEQSPQETPAGIHVRLDAAGTIVSERHHWWLRLF